MLNATRPPRGAERRRKTRVQLTRSIVARLGAMGAVILDITDAGARIEHFTRLDVGKKARLRFDWQAQSLDVEATVVSCRVHRFAHGDDGTTVYQSGLFFSSCDEQNLTMLKELVATVVARSLAEQVANARGIGPVTERNMPVFRSGVVATTKIDDSDGRSGRFLPSNAVVADRGYVKCVLIDGRRWEKKWSRTPEEPADGFTVLATEPADHLEQLCETYLKGDAAQRNLIRMLARVSVEKAQDTPEPV
jgi:hypothetical protein